MTGSDALTDGDTPDMVAFEKLYVPENSRAYPNVVRRVVEELLIDA
jgi:hypothetical protein